MKKKLALILSIVLVLAAVICVLAFPAAAEEDELSYAETQANTLWESNEVTKATSVTVGGETIDLTKQAENVKLNNGGTYSVSSDGKLTLIGVGVSSTVAVNPTDGGLWLEVNNGEGVAANLTFGGAVYRYTAPSGRAPLIVTSSDKTVLTGTGIDRNEGDIIIFGDIGINCNKNGYHAFAIQTDSGKGYDMILAPNVDSSIVAAGAGNAIQNSSGSIVIAGNAKISISNTSNTSREAKIFALTGSTSSDAAVQILENASLDISHTGGLVMYLENNVAKGTDVLLVDTTGTVLINSKCVDQRNEWVSTIRAKTGSVRIKNGSLLINTQVTGWEATAKNHTPSAIQIANVSDYADAGVYVEGNGELVINMVEASSALQSNKQTILYGITNTRGVVNVSGSGKLSVRVASEKNINTYPIYIKETGAINISDSAKVYVEQVGSTSSNAIYIGSSDKEADIAAWKGKAGLWVTGGQLEVVAKAGYGVVVCNTGTMESYTHFSDSVVLVKNYNTDSGTGVFGKDVTDSNNYSTIGTYKFVGAVTGSGSDPARRGAACNDGWAYIAPDANYTYYNGISENADFFGAASNVDAAIVDVTYDANGVATYTYTIPLETNYKIGNNIMRLNKGTKLCSKEALTIAMTDAAAKIVDDYILFTDTDSIVYYIQDDASDDIATVHNTLNSGSIALDANKNQVVVSNVKGHKIEFRLKDDYTVTVGGENTFTTTQNNVFWGDGGVMTLTGDATTDKLTLSGNQYILGTQSNDFVINGSLVVNATATVADAIHTAQTSGATDFTVEDNVVITLNAPTSVVRVTGNVYVKGGTVTINASNANEVKALNAQEINLSNGSLAVTSPGSNLVVATNINVTGGTLKVDCTGGSSWRGIFGNLNVSEDQEGVDTNVNIKCVENGMSGGTMTVTGGTVNATATNAYALCPARLIVSGGVINATSPANGEGGYKGTIGVESVEQTGGEINVYLQNVINAAPVVGLKLEGNGPVNFNGGSLTIKDIAPSSAPSQVLGIWTNSTDINFGGTAVSIDLTESLALNAWVAGVKLQNKDAVKYDANGTATPNPDATVKAINVTGGSIDFRGVGKSALFRLDSAKCELNITGGKITGVAGYFYGTNDYGEGYDPSVINLSENAKIDVYYSQASNGWTGTNPTITDKATWLKNSSISDKNHWLTTGNWDSKNVKVILTLKDNSQVSLYNYGDDAIRQYPAENPNYILRMDGQLDLLLSNDVPAGEILRLHANGDLILRLDKDEVVNLGAEDISDVLNVNGDLTIEGEGTLKIASLMNGIKVNGELQITGGNIEVTSNYKGHITFDENNNIVSGTDENAPAIEAGSFTMIGGHLVATSLEGKTLNVTSGETHFYGGVAVIKSLYGNHTIQGNGNGKIYFHGGTVYVNCDETSNSTDGIQGKIGVTDSQKWCVQSNAGIVVCGSTLYGYGTVGGVLHVGNQKAKIEITGGTVYLESQSDTIRAQLGDIVISGGNVTAIASTYRALYAQNGSISVSDDAIVNLTAKAVSGDTGALEAAKNVTVNGGKLTVNATLANPNNSKSAAAIYCNNETVTDTTKGVSISGGEVILNVTGAGSYGSGIRLNAATLNVTGTGKLAVYVQDDLSGGVNDVACGSAIDLAPGRMTVEDSAKVYIYTKADIGIRPFATETMVADKTNDVYTTWGSYAGVYVSGGQLEVYSGGIPFNIGSKGNGVFTNPNGDPDGRYAYEASFSYSGGVVIADCFGNNNYAFGKNPGNAFSNYVVLGKVGGSGSEPIGSEFDRSSAPDGWVFWGTDASYQYYNPLGDTVTAAKGVLVTKVSDNGYTFQAPRSTDVTNKTLQYQLDTVTLPLVAYEKVAVATNPVVKIVSGQDYSQALLVTDSDKVVTILDGVNNTVYGENMITYKADGTTTFNNVASVSRVVATVGNLDVTLNGNNSIVNSGNSALYLLDGNLSVKGDSSASLEVTSNNSGVPVYVLNGSYTQTGATLVVTGYDWSGIAAGCGISISNATVKSSANYNAIYSYAAMNITNSAVTATVTGDNAVRAAKDLTISGSTVKVTSAGGYAIKGDSSVTVENSMLLVSSNGYGIKSPGPIYLNSGNVYINCAETSTVDTIVPSGSYKGYYLIQSDTGIYFNGAKVYVYGDGQGVHTNKYIEVNAGVLAVNVTGDKAIRAQKGSIAIKGGTVNATSGTNIAIHVENQDQANNTLTISGGTVNLTAANKYAAAVVGDLTISGDAQVTAVANNNKQSTNDTAETINVSGKVVITGNAEVTAEAPYRNRALVANGGLEVSGNASVTASANPNQDYGAYDTIYVQNGMTVSDNATIDAKAGSENAIRVASGDYTQSGGTVTAEVTKSTFKGIVLNVKNNINISGGKLTINSASVMLSKNEEFNNDYYQLGAIVVGGNYTQTGGLVDVTTNQYRNGISMRSANPTLTLGGDAILKISSRADGIYIDSSKDADTSSTTNEQKVALVVKDQAQLNISRSNCAIRLSGNVNYKLNESNALVSDIKATVIGNITFTDDAQVNLSASGQVILSNLNLTQQSSTMEVSGNAKLYLANTGSYHGLEWRATSANPGSVVIKDNAYVEVTGQSSDSRQLVKITGTLSLEDKAELKVTQNSVYSAVYASSSITLSDEAKLTASNTGYHTIQTATFNLKDNATVNGYAGDRSSGSYYALNATTANISGGTLNLKAGSTAVANVTNYYQSGGTVNLEMYDTTTWYCNGLSAKVNEITGGTLNVEATNVGIYWNSETVAPKITIKGNANVNVLASKTGINASTTKNTYYADGSLEISGDALVLINAQNTGINSSVDTVIGGDATVDINCVDGTALNAQYKTNTLKIQDKAKIDIDISAMSSTWQAGIKVSNLDMLAGEVTIDIDSAEVTKACSRIMSAIDIQGSTYAYGYANFKGGSIVANINNNYSDTNYTKLDGDKETTGNTNENRTFGIFLKNVSAVNLAGTDVEINLNTQLKNGNSGLIAVQNSPTAINISGGELKFNANADVLALFYHTVNEGSITISGGMITGSANYFWHANGFRDQVLTVTPDAMIDFYSYSGDSIHLGTKNSFNKSCYNWYEDEGVEYLPGCSLYDSSEVPGLQSHFITTANMTVEGAATQVEIVVKEGSSTKNYVLNVDNRFYGGETPETAKAYYTPYGVVYVNNLVAQTLLANGNVELDLDGTSTIAYNGQHTISSTGNIAFGGDGKIEISGTDYVVYSKGNEIVIGEKAEVNIIATKGNAIHINNDSYPTLFVSITDDAKVNIEATESYKVGDDGKVTYNNNGRAIYLRGIETAVNINGNADVNLTTTDIAIYALADRGGEDDLEKASINIGGNAKVTVDSEIAFQTNGTVSSVNINGNADVDLNSDRGFLIYGADASLNIGGNADVHEIEALGDAVNINSNTVAPKGVKQSAAMNVTDNASYVLDGAASCGARIQISAKDEDGNTVVGDTSFNVSGEAFVDMKSEGQTVYLHSLGKSTGSATASVSDKANVNLTNVSETSQYGSALTIYSYDNNVEFTTTGTVNISGKSAGWNGALYANYPTGGKTNVLIKDATVNVTNIQSTTYETLNSEGTNTFGGNLSNAMNIGGKGEFLVCGNAVLNAYAERSGDAYNNRAHGLFLHPDMTLKIADNAEANFSAGGDSKANSGAGIHLKESDIIVTDNATLRASASGTAVAGITFEGKSSLDVTKYGVVFIDGGKDAAGVRGYNKDAKVVINAKDGARVLLTGAPALNLKNGTFEISTSEVVAGEGKADSKETALSVVEREYADLGYVYLKGSMRNPNTSDMVITSVVIVAILAAAAAVAVIYIRKKKAQN